MIYDLWEFLVKKIAVDVAWGCFYYHASITSGIRSEKHNEAIHGSKSSWHLDALAYDIIIDDEKNKSKVIDYFEKKGYRILETGKGVIRTGRAFHVQYNWPVIECTRNDLLTHLKLIYKEVDNVTT